MSSPKHLVVMNSQANAQLDVVLRALEQYKSNESDTTNHLEKINLSSCIPVFSVQKLMNEKPIIRLVDLFKGCGFIANVGCNQGSGDVYIHIKLPNVAEDHIVENEKNVIVWAMLGLFPLSSEIERLNIDRKYTSPTPTDTGEVTYETQVLLANRALKCFALATSVGVTRIRTNLHERTMRIVIEPFTRLITKTRDGKLYSDNMTALYTYGPMYHRLSGYDRRLPGYSTERLLEARSLLLKEMVSSFWGKLSSFRYFPDPKLQSEVSHFLTEYLDAGIKDSSADFAPYKRALALYLYGTAGVGKSTFVRLFSEGLRHIIQLYVDPKKVSAIVKIPLNSISPEKLNSILRVRGISDWSVERIVEQTITKGGVVILHLEENPEDPVLQEQLFERVQLLLSSVTRRYPEYASNVLYVFTSNYQAAPTIAKSTRQVTVRTPSSERQLEWSRQVLQDSIRAHPGCKDISVTLEKGPPAVTDMRHLEKWRTSVGYLIDSYLLSGETEIISKAKREIHVREGDSRKSLSIQLTGLQTKEIIIHTDDGFFYYLQKPNLPADVSTCTVSREIICKVNLISDMVKCEYLRPGVVTVHQPTHEMRTECVDFILSLIRCRFEVGKLHEIEVVLNDETDGDKLYGDQQDAVLRGFPRFIDEITNPIYERNDEFVLVIAYVSVLGQFMIRELLESANSKTHRILIRKDRLIFVVCTTDGFPIQSQLESRSHVICTP